MTRLLIAFLTLAAASAFSQPRFEVLSATYGAGSVQVDVTERVRSLVVDDGLNIEVNGSTLAMDPIPNTRKTLRVVYTQGFFRRIAEAKDFEMMRIGNVPPESLKILSAKVTTDVTSEVSAKVVNNKLELPMTSPILKGGTGRTLTVEYEINGKKKTETIKEGEVLRLNAAPAASTTTGSGNLRIIRATYGAGRRATNDVTRAVSERVVNDLLQITVDGQTLGGDPAPGRVKTLVIQYEIDGRRQSVTARDGETVIIPKVTSLNILSATYGVPGRSVNVTGAVNSRVSNLRLELPVNASTMGTDPVPGAVKSLSVEYEVNGRRESAYARDGETLVLPAGVAQSPSASQAQAGASRNICLYREANYQGESVCLQSGQELTAVQGGSMGFRSIRLNGAPSVQLFNQAGFRGEAETITTDIPDMESMRSTWWRYDSTARVQSIRAR